MSYCVVSDCKSSWKPGRKEEGVTFHLFPRQDLERRKKWENFVGRSDWVPRNRSHICSKHFSPEMFDRTGQTVRLREWAVPTISVRPKRNICRKIEIVKAKVRKKEPDLVVSQRKRNTKAKRRDDKIIDWGSKCRKVLVKNVTKNQMDRSEKTNKQKGANKRTIDFQLIERSAAGVKRKQKPIKIEKDNGYPSGDSKSDLREELMNIKEEPMVFEVLDLSDDDLEDTPDASPIKRSRDSVKIEGNGDPGSIGVSKEFASTSVQNRNKSNGKVTVKTKVVKTTASSGKTAPALKDKIVQLPNNRMYFEFVKPKKKVILHIKPTSETHELKSQTLEELLYSLKLRHLISSEAEELLEAFRKLPKGLMRVDETEREKLPRLHTEEVKKFATVIYLYSPKAYDLVGTLFWLPDKKRLQERLQNKGHWPGFTQEALEMLKNSNCKSPAELCTIMFDFISIKKHCDFDASVSRWIGHVDFCGGPDPDDSDGIPVASEILMFTAVGLARDWKLPFGYFLSDGLSGEALQNLVTEAIKVLEGCGLKVRVLVCDGTRRTIKMGVLFGCNLHTKSFRELVTSFPHPLDEHREIHLAFGLQHSLNLLQNLLAEKGILRSSTYGVIDWKFYAKLLGNGKNTQLENIDLQDPDHIEFCHLQRIIRCCHPSFNIMVTRLFELADDLKMKEFKDSEATANFMADVYRAFDMLNSRNPVTTGEKPPITNLFVSEQIESMNVIGQRIFGLELLSGSRVIDVGRWMSVMLFPFTLKSVSVIASNLLNQDSLKYFTTYRLNLDHSDMILSCIQRYGGGWDGIPTASEFRQGYKSFLNSCAKSSKISTYYNDFDGNDLTVGQGVICPFRRHLHHVPVHDDIDFVLQAYCLIDLRMDVAVKARCVLRHISHRLSCTECVALMVDNNDYFSELKKIINLDYIRPSRFMTKLVEISERILKMKLLESNQLNFEHTVIYIFTECLSVLGKLNNLSVSSDHMIEEPYHVICLIKAVIRTIISFRLKSTNYLSVVKSKLLKGFR